MASVDGCGSRYTSSATVITTHVTSTIVTDREVINTGANTKSTGLACASKYQTNNSADDGSVIKLRTQAINFDRIINDGKTKVLDFMRY